MLAGSSWSFKDVQDVVRWLVDMINEIRKIVVRLCDSMLRVW
jgi:hypothetical protein